MESKFQQSILLICILLSLVNSGSAKPTVADSKKWDFLLLAHFWPPTSCYFFEQHCSGIPEGVKGWTIHGLWPSVPGDMHQQPYNCNASAHFDYSKIESLSDQLDTEWPDYNNTTSRTALWKHEWEKHGTCAEDLPALRGMFNFFNRTLQLHKSMDILGALEKRGITPSSTKTYRAQDFYNALVAEYNVKPSLVCLPKDGTVYIDQVYLCFNKSFAFQDCDHTTGFLTGRWGKNVGDPVYGECPDQGMTEVRYPTVKRPGKTKEAHVMYFESEIKETITWQENQ